MTAHSPNHHFDDSVVIPSLGNQLGLDLGTDSLTREDGAMFNCEEPDILFEADKVLIFFSGGKDSIFCFLRMLELGIPREKIVLMHHLIDGKDEQFMDWPHAEDYCRKFAAHFGVEIRFSWLHGGFKGELMKENAISQPTSFEALSGEIKTIERDAARSKPATRRRFPQVSGNLAVRWCSAELKIAVGRKAVTHDESLLGKKTVCLSGERREESSGRAKYWQFEPHTARAMSDKKKRDVWVHRPALNASEEEVWALLEKYQVLPPPAYQVGLSRMSCMSCIFARQNTLATLRHYWPNQIDRIASLENEFDTFISRDRIDVVDLSKKGTPFICDDPEIIRQAGSEEYFLPIVATEDRPWAIPAGAFGTESCGAS